MPDRAFGYVFAATLAAIGAVAWLTSAQTLSAWLLVISGAFLAAAFFTPELLWPLNALHARLLDSVTPHLHHGFCRIFVTIWWNGVLIVGGMSLIALPGEAWFLFARAFHGK